MRPAHRSRDDPWGPRHHDRHNRVTAALHATPRPSPSPRSVTHEVAEVHSSFHGADGPGLTPALPTPGHTAFFGVSRLT